jgi:hypothetical protein
VAQSFLICGKESAIAFLVDLLSPTLWKTPFDWALGSGALLRLCDETTTLTEAVSMFWPPQHHEHLPTILGD